MHVFLWRWRQVPIALAIVALFTYVTVSGQWNFYKPWIDGALLTLCAVTFLSIWLN